MTHSRAKSALDVALREYLAEYGAEGYDKTTFIDFVVTHTEQGGADVEGLIYFYERRAAALAFDFLRPGAALLARRRAKPKRRRAARGGS